MVEIDGSVAPGFDGVAEVFSDNFERRGDVGAECCVYLDGNPVVDVWGGYREDAVQIVFSSTKGATAACANFLVEPGQLDLDAPVVEVWPEFGQNGKEKTLVRWIVTHKSGVLAPAAGFSLDDLQAWDRIVESLAVQSPAWEPGTAYGYHAHTFGWLVGELIRRTDGRGLGQFFAEEIAGPAGADFWIGLPESEESRVASLVLLDIGESSHSVEAPEPNPLSETASSLNGLFADMCAAADDRRYRSAQLGRAGGVGSARGLARLYKWVLENFSPGTIAEFLRRETSGPDLVLSSPGAPIEQRFARGFLAPPDLSRGGTESFGHGGAGGTAAFADPKRQLAFAYTTRGLRFDPDGGSRAQILIDSTYEALG